MRITPFLAGLLLLLSAGALAQGNQTQTQSQPKPKKAPKPKKIGPRVIILKIVDQSGATGDASSFRSLYARAGVLTDFQKAKIEDISPAEVQGTIDQLEIDFTKTDNWTPENFDKLADPWQATYMAGLVINDVSATPATKTTNDTAAADVTLWLYNARIHEFIAKAQPFHWVYKPKKRMETAVDPKSLEWEVLSEAAMNGFKQYLSPQKKSH